LPHHPPEISDETALRCVYSNCASLYNKLHELNDLISLLSPQLILITESWLTPDISDCEITPPGYKAFRFDSPRGRTGGVCLFALNSLPITLAPIQLPPFTFIDSLWYGLKLRDCDHLLIGLIYRSPSSTPEDDVFLSNLLSRLPALHYTHYLIAGDFNAPAINWRTKTAPSSGFDPVLLNTVSTLGWYQHSIDPTRFRTGQRPSTLDLILTNEGPMVDEVTILSPLGRSDHAVLSWELLCYWQSVSSPTFPRFAFHRGDYAGMIRHLGSLDWSLLLTLPAEEQEQAITSKVTEACGLFIPLHIPSDRSHPKYPGPLRRLLNRKRSLWARYVRTQCEADYSIYLELRRKCVLLTRDHKRKNETQLLTRAQNSPKLLFRYLRTQRKVKPSPLSLTTQLGGLTESPSEAAETLATTYQLVFTNHPAGSNTQAATSHAHTSPSLTHVSFPTQAVEKLLSFCDPGGSPGPDGIHPRILKECASVLALPYSILFSSSFSSGSLPSSWKRAIIHPIYKGGNRHDPSNYRPISLTSIPCKIMEKLINRSLQSFLISNNLFHPAQHGFLPSRSCLSNLAHFLSDLTCAAELKMKLDCIFFDFAKAFDVIPHDLTISHWERLGVLGPLSNWLSSFLLGRSSRVRVCGSLSSEFSVTSGVPQGSVLGPTIFIMFINTLPSVLPTGSKALLFADDLKVWSDDPSTLQDAIDACYRWSQANRLPFNPHKIEHMSFIHPSDSVFSLPTPSGSYTIPTVDQHKDLGVWITPNLTPSLMCLHSSKKAIRMVNFLRRVFPLIDQRNFIILFSSFVRPLLEHCNVVWLPWLKRDENMLENVQRKATKMVPSLRNLPYADRLSRLNLFPLKYRRLRGCLIHTYRLFQSGSHLQFFTLTQNCHLRGHSRKLFLHRFSTRSRRNFFSSVVVPLWNKLPETAVTAPSVLSFKQALDKFLPRILYPSKQ
jgi:hypothetical protein